MRARIARWQQSDQTGGVCPAKTKRSLEKPVKPGLVMRRDGCAGGQGLKRYVDVGRCSSAQATGPV